MSWSQIVEILPAAASWIILLTLNSIYFICICFQFASQTSWVIFIVHLIFAIFVIVTFARTTFMNPGFLPAVCLHMIAVFVVTLFYVLWSEQPLDTHTNIIAMVLMSLVGLVFIPVLSLTIFHITIISRGMTTNEQAAIMEISKDV